MKLNVTKLFNAIKAKKFGRTLEESKLLTDAEISKEIGITPSILSKINKGQTDISLKSYGEICDWLGANSSEFFY